ncbi:hypothetical protein pb186bvf_008466 [Paramecium bursaria]
MQSFTIFQWNTLANSLCTTDSFPNVDPAFLQWEYRQKLIQKIIQESKADIYCLEEVDEPQFYMEILQGYKTYFYKKPAEDNKDGIFIATKIPLDGEPLVKFYFENGKQQNQFFVKIQIHHIQIYITHLKAKPKFELVRKEQLVQLAANFTDQKIIVVGDFNTSPELEAVSHFQELTQLKTINNGVPTTAKNRGKLEVGIKDYILYRNIDLLESYIPHLTQDEGGLPSEHFPSDHLNLVAKFRPY